jgi:hypothetical protein
MLNASLVSKNRESFNFEINKTDVLVNDMCVGNMPTLQIKQYSETRTQEYKPLSLKVSVENWCKSRILFVS